MTERTPNPDHPIELILFEEYELGFKAATNLLQQIFYGEVTRDEMYKLYTGLISNVAFYEGFAEETLKIKGKNYLRTSILQDWYIRRTG